MLGQEPQPRAPRKECEVHLGAAKWLPVSVSCSGPRTATCRPVAGPCCANAEYPPHGVKGNALQGIGFAIERLPSVCGIPNYSRQEVPARDPDARPYVPAPPRSPVSKPVPVALWVSPAMPSSAERAWGRGRRKRVAAPGSCRSRSSPPGYGSPFSASASAPAPSCAPGTAPAS